MTLSLIAAMARRRVIGRGGAIPWRLPADMKRFKQTTMGHWLIMGRRTFESIGRPLPGRTIIVVTRRPGWSAEGVLAAHSIEDALELARGQDDVYVAGGALIYEAAMPIADRLHLTLIELDVDGDAFFPAWDESHWRVASEERHGADGASPAYRFLTLDRIPGRLDSPGTAD